MTFIIRYALVLFILTNWRLLVRQLYRVFPISHGYFLSKLLFSPDSSKSRILVAREVHSASEYLQCTSPFAGRSYPNPLLRFSVFDETPGQSLGSLLGDSSQPQLVDLARESLISDSTDPPFTPMSFSHIPPPPIIYSASSSSETAMLPPFDVVSSTPRQNSAFPQYQQAQYKPDEAMSRDDTYNVDRAKADVDSLVAKLKDDLDVVLTNAFRSRPASIAERTPVAPVMVEFPPTPATTFSLSYNTPVPMPSLLPPMCLFKYCMPCAKVFQGPWYSCTQCAAVVVSGPFTPSRLSLRFRYSVRTAIMQEC